MNDGENQQIELNQKSEEFYNEEPLVLKPAGIKPKKQRWNKKTGIVIILTVLIAAGLLVFVGIKLQVPRRIALLHPSEETIRKDVTKYLEERYQEEFVITNILFPSFNYASYIITAYPAGSPQKLDYKVTIHGWEKRGLIHYYDNYPIMKIIPELRDYISEVVSEYFPENKVYVQDIGREWIRENMDKEFSFDEFINDIEGEWHSCGWYHICIPYKTKDDKELLNRINEMVACMAEKKISGFFFVDIIYRNFDEIPDDYTTYGLGENGKDFDNYSYFIDRYGNFHEETEVRTEWP